MTTLLSLKRPENFTREVTIRMNDGSDFQLKLRNPSFEFQIKDNSGAGWSARFEELIVGWEGVNVEGDNGEPTPLGWSPESFQTICENYPTVFVQATSAIIKLLNDLPAEDQESGKSSSGPSDDSDAPGSSAETSTATT